MRKAFFLLFLLSSVISFAQSSLYSDLNPNGQWYTDESRDAAYESSVSKLHKTWISIYAPDLVSSITFKPNGIGKVVQSIEEYISEAGMYVTFSVETPFTYTKNKDKISLKTNPLKSIVSINQNETNLSQRKKDILKKAKNEYTVKTHKQGPIRHNYSLYRIDDYMVLCERSSFAAWTYDEISRFVSKEYQEQAEARKAEQTKAENKEE